MKQLLLSILLLPVGSMAQKVDSRKIDKFFSKVARVELCELSKFIGPYIQDHSGDSSAFEEFKTIIQGEALDYERIRKKKEIGDSTILLLKNSLLNSEMPTGGRSFCYEPRNGILFYDKNNKLIAYLELCFTCTGYSWFHQPWNSEVTSVQIQTLKVLFQQEGIEIYY